MCAFAPFSCVDGQRLTSSESGARQPIDHRAKILLTCVSWDPSKGWIPQELHALPFNACLWCSQWHGVSCEVCQLAVEDDDDDDEECKCWINVNVSDNGEAELCENKASRGEDDDDDDDDDDDNDQYEESVE